jgi:Uma2 family endonuclease
MTITETPTTTPLTYEVAELFPRQGQWSEHDYWALPERNRIIELSDRKLVIPPMPTNTHQMIIGNLFVALRIFLEQHSAGLVRVAPLPVRLWEGKIREPDVMVMLNEHLERVQHQYWEAPDLVVEVLSPSTKKTDSEEKQREYASAGIREYWVVDPERRSVRVFWLDGEVYTLAAHATGNEQLESRLLQGFVLPIGELFE